MDAILGSFPMGLHRKMRLNNLPLNQLYKIYYTFNSILNFFNIEYSNLIIHFQSELLIYTIYLLLYLNYSYYKLVEILIQKKSIINFISFNKELLIDWLKID